MKLKFEILLKQRCLANPQQAKWDTGSEICSLRSARLQTGMSYVSCQGESTRSCDVDAFRLMLKLKLWNTDSH